MTHAQRPERTRMRPVDLERKLGNPADGGPVRADLGLAAGAELQDDAAALPETARTPVTGDAFNASVAANLARRRAATNAFLARVLQPFDAGRRDQHLREIAVRDHGEAAGAGP